MHNAQADPEGNPQGGEREPPGLLYTLMLVVSVAMGVFALAPRRVPPGPGTAAGGVAVRVLDGGKPAVGRWVRLFGRLAILAPGQGGASARTAATDDRGDAALGDEPGWRPTLHVRSGAAKPVTGARLRLEIGPGRMGGGASPLEAWVEIEPALRTGKDGYARFGAPRTLQYLVRVGRGGAAPPVERLVAPQAGTGATTIDLAAPPGPGEAAPPGNEATGASAPGATPGATAPPAGTPSPAAEAAGPRSNGPAPGACEVTVAVKRVGRVVESVTVTLHGRKGDRTGVTDARGETRFTGLAAGTYQVRASMPGYGASATVGVPTAETIRLNLVQTASHPASPPEEGRRPGAGR